jgi:hypothetical protein
VAKGTTIQADEAGSWDSLHDRFEVSGSTMKSISIDGACTNWAEEFSAGCAAPRLAITTISPACICSAMRKRLHDAKMTAVCPTASKWIVSAMTAKPSVDFSRHVAS